ncbi:MAG: hypothetical protein EA350_15950 [Gemmatimonadales bacterium]|nr:MAG: hypothetical protein EA350_15950 [Gemmatimonadales bacterium]
MAVAAALLAAPLSASAQMPPPPPSPDTAQVGSDPRIGLSAGWMDAETSILNMELLSTTPRPEGFYDPENVGNLGLANSDLAFQGDLVFVGNFAGWNAYDISDPGNPRLATSVLCPGGQGDISVYRNLLFMSVEAMNGRIDCGTEGAPGAVNPERFRGIRVFDISDLENPVQVAAVQTCRGSHTHTLLEDANDPDHIYVYNSGAAGVRSPEELEGCIGSVPEEDPDASALFRIEVIKVSLANPEDAHIASQPRVFADRETGDIAGLWPGGDHGDGSQRSATTNHCHDITIYPELGLAAGACSGNGILLDISDPVNPVRVDEVIDTNFAYWHSATFNNDGTTVIFTDEWGGGTAARCRAEDPAEWGANAFFRIEDGRMEHAGYYKLPVPQTDTENCVAHNGSLVPVPGRDIKVQAWYQGGISVFDFTDPENPFEIAHFDRGPISEDRLVTGGQWSSYWYNGLIVGSEIARGLDVLRLTPGEHLTQNEIDAANLISFEEFNPQHQPRIEWPEHPAVARAYTDQLVRSGAMSEDQRQTLFQVLDRYEAGGAERDTAVATFRQAAVMLREGAPRADGADRTRMERLAETLAGLASAGADGND